MRRCGAELMRRLDMEFGASIRTARGLRLIERDLRGCPINEAIEVLVQVEHRLERVANLRDLGRHLRDPVACRDHDRTDREDREQQENDHAQACGGLRRNAPPLEPFEQRHQRDRDDQRGGHRHEEFGAGSERERHGDDRADAGDQGQRGEQPVALGGDGLRQRPRFIGGFVLDRLMLSGARVHGGDYRTTHAVTINPCRRWHACGPSAAALGGLLVPLVRLERTLR